MLFEPSGAPAKRTEASTVLPGAFIDTWRATGVAAS